MYQHILVAIDGSDTARFATEEAIRFAREQNARLRFIHVVDEDVIYWSAGGVILDSVFETLRKSGQAILDEAVAAAGRAGVPAETVLQETVGKRLPDVIVQEAATWPADLLVLGTRGRGGLEQLLLGSVSEGVARLAPVPVLLMRAQTAASPATASVKDKVRGKKG
ncbi:MAG: universal stress protein [Acidiferrobacterales bacterium]